MRKFDKLFNTIMEEAKASKIKAKKVIKEDQDIEYNLDSESYAAVFNMFRDCIEFDIENSEYDLGDVDVTELANEYFKSCLQDPDITSAIQSYLADTEDSVSELNDALNYWVMDNIIGDLENKASFGKDWQWS